MGCYEVLDIKNDIYTVAFYKNEFDGSPVTMSLDEDEFEVLTQGKVER